MSDLYYNRFRTLRDRYSRSTWGVIAVIVVTSIVVIGVCVSSSYDGDRSSAVKDRPPQAEMNASDPSASVSPATLKPDNPSPRP
jgi:hypothetical protein